MYQNFEREIKFFSRVLTIKDHLYLLKIEMRLEHLRESAVEDQSAAIIIAVYFQVMVDWSIGDYP